MPYQQSWVPAEERFSLFDVGFYAVYKNDDVESGMLHNWFCLTPEDGEEESVDARDYPPPPASKRKFLLEHLRVGGQPYKQRQRQWSTQEEDNALRLAYAAWNGSIEVPVYSEAFVLAKLQEILEDEKESDARKVAHGIRWAFAPVKKATNQLTRAPAEAIED